MLEDDIGQHGGVDFELVEDGSDHALFLENESAKQMNGIDMVLSPFDGQFMGPSQGFSGFGREFVEWRHDIILIQKGVVSQ